MAGFETWIRPGGAGTFCAYRCFFCLLVTPPKGRYTLTVGASS